MSTAPRSTLFPYTTLFRSGAEGQDVRRFPDGKPLPDLKGVEFGGQGLGKAPVGRDHRDARGVAFRQPHGGHAQPDRKSTRLNSSHVKISYAVFCLKKKND